LFPQPSLGLEAENAVFQRREAARKGPRMKGSITRSEQAMFRHGYRELL
jgi:hypothetical protein